MRRRAWKAPNFDHLNRLNFGAVSATFFSNKNSFVCRILQIPWRKMGGHSIEKYPWSDGGFEANWAPNLLEPIDGKCSNFSRSKCQYWAYLKDQKLSPPSNTLVASLGGLPGELEYFQRAKKWYTSYQGSTSTAWQTDPQRQTSFTKRWAVSRFLPP